MLSIVENAGGTLQAKIGWSQRLPKQNVKLRLLEVPQRKGTCAVKHDSGGKDGRSVLSKGCVVAVTTYFIIGYLITILEKR